jgi:O-antigen ligase/polysaccharide polymerase Wzy-like membrane protein
MMEHTRRTWIANRRSIGGPPALAVSLFHVVGVLLATTLASFVVYRFGLNVFLGVAALGAAVIGVIFRPDFATVLTVFVLYLNVPAILHKHHGISEMLAGSFVLALGVPLVNAVVLRHERFRADTTLMLMLLFLLVLFFGTQVSMNTEIAANYIRRYLLEGVLLYWLFTNVIRTLPQLKRAIAALVVAGALLGGVNAYQEVTKSYDQKFGGLAYRPVVEMEDLGDREPSTEERHLRSDRAHGPVEEPNRFAQVLVVLLPLAIFGARSTARRHLRMYWTVGAALILAGVLVTFSRGAALTIVLVMIAAIWMRWIRPVYLIASTAAVIITVPIVAPHMIKRVESISAATNLLSDDPTQYTEMDGAIRGRATEMMAAFYAFRDHPVIGVGPGQYAPMYSLHYQQVGIKFRDRQITRRAHSLYLEMAAETGIIGLGVFLSIVGILIRDLWRARCRLLGRDAQLTNLATACILALACYLGTGTFLHLAYQRYYWILLAIAGAALRIIRDLEPSADRSAPHAERLAPV